MADVSILAGATSQSILVDLYILATGAPQTTLVYNSSGLTAYYSFAGASATSTAITLATLASATAAWSSGGFIKLDDTNMPGAYRFDLPNAVVAASKGREVVVTFNGFSGMATRHIKIELTGWDNQNATTGGLAALPATACTTNASLLTSGTGTDQISNSSGKVLLQATQTGVTIPTVTTVTNQLTAAAIATGVWQDATAGDFTVSNSIGKSLYTSGNAPGAASGIAIVGSNVTFASGTDFSSTMKTSLSAATPTVTIATGTGAGQLSITSGVVSANTVQWTGTNVATPNTAGVPIVDTRQLVRQGTAQASGSTTTAIKLDSGASATNGYYNGMLVLVIAGTGAPQAGICTGYVGSTKVATITPAWPTAPDATSLFQIFPAIVDLESWEYTAPNVLQSGRVDSYLGATGAVTVAANTTQFAGQTVTAAAGVTFPTSVASPTNITAGTITTVTNLTNAPTAGDFTATMKTSLNAATPTVVLSASADPTIATGTATAGTNTTITLQTALGANGLCNGSLLKITSGTGAKQSRTITGYVDSTKVATVDRPWTTNPDATSVYAVLTADNAGIDSSQRISEVVLVDTLTTYTSNTPQTGDSFARIGSTGSGLTSLAPAATALSTATWTAPPTGFLAATFPTGTVANTTNITAGTITTTTNLTNAPTSGDFTGTMKTSLNAATPASVVGAVGSVTGAVGSVTGNVGGNVAGSVASVATAVTLSASDSPTVATGTATAGGASTITLQSALGANSLCNGCAIKITAGTGAKQTRTIVGYVNSTQVATVDRPWTTNPDATSVYAILAADNPALSSTLAVTSTAADPWGVSLPGAYGAGTAGAIVGTNLDTNVGSRMATYTQPTGFLAATFPGTVASPTNITAGTITTVATTTTATNLTNAPTNGDFTAAMKSSLNAATPASVVGAVGSVTGNVGGNVTGSVGSIAGVTFPSNFGSLTINANGGVNAYQYYDAGQSAYEAWPNNLYQTGITPGGIVKADLQTIKTQAVTCAAGVTVGAFVGNATHALAVDASGYVTYNNTAPLTPTQTAQAVWNAVASSYDTALSMGALLNSAGGVVTVGGYSTGQDPATLVWNALTASFDTANTFGAAVQASASPWGGIITTTQAGELQRGMGAILLGNSASNSTGTAQSFQDGLDPTTTRVTAVNAAPPTSGTAAIRTVTLN